MKKRIICCLLVAVMMLGATAYAKDYMNELVIGYATGESIRTIDADDFIEEQSVDATISGSVVTISAGGTATYGFYVPYGTRKVTLAYEGASGATTVVIDGKAYNSFPLSGSGTYDLVFGENLGIASQDYSYNNANYSGYQREYVEHRGEKLVSVQSEGGMTLKSLTFEREKTPKPTLYRVPAVSDGTSATYSTVMLDENATIIVVNGARRYVNNENILEKPYSYNGHLYLPINTLAKALGYYHEDYPEKGYALMRSETHEVVLLGGQSKVSTGLSAQTDTPYEVLVYRNGRTYGAVRYFAELAGETVGYRDGLVVIDNRYTVEDILKYGSLNKYARAKFEPFKKSPKQGKKYYVDQNSQAENETGSEEEPFKTITQAANIANAGDTVIVKDGIYRETLAPVNNGTENSPINFVAEGDNVVISANDVLSEGWTLHEENIYKTTMSWDMGATQNQIFIDDKMQTEARYPNGPELLYDTEKLDEAWTVRGDMWRPAGDSTTKEWSTVRSASLFWNADDNYWDSGYYIGTFGTAYSVHTGNIIGSSKGEIYIGDEKDAHWGDGGSYHTITFGYIVGNYKALDAKGEWIRDDDGSLYMIFPDGATPNVTPVEAKARTLTIDLKDKKFINVVGFNTIGGSARANDSEMCMLNGLDMKYITHYLHQKDSYKGYIDFSKSDTAKNGDTEEGKTGIYIAGTDNMVINCNIDHSAGAGIFVSGTYNYIENNILSNCGYVGSYISGIYSASRPYDSITKPMGGHAIYNNTVYNNGRSCLCISSAKGHSHPTYLPYDVAYNDFHDGMLSTVDTGITYEYCVQMDIDGYSSALHHNYVYTTTSQKDKNPYSVGIYHDGGSHGFDTYKNQVFCEGENTGFTSGYAYMQQDITTPSYYRKWDNGENVHIEGGASGLTEDYFTEERPFFAGALRDIETFEPVKYTRNYDKFKAGNYGMKYTTLGENVTTSEGVTINPSTGYASFSGDGQYVKFSNVEFPEGCETMALAIRGDSHHGKDKIDVVICGQGADIATGKTYNVVADTGAYDTDVSERLVFNIERTTGYYDVYVKVNEYRSVEIGGLGAYAIKDTAKPIEDWAAFAWGGEVDKYIHYNGTTANPVTTTLPGVAFGKTALRAIYHGRYLKFDDVVIDDTTDAFVINASCNSGRRQPYKLYVEPSNSTTVSGTPVATFIEDGYVVGDKRAQYVPLNESISAGTYDVYLDYVYEEGRSNEWYNSALVYIGFLRENATLNCMDKVDTKIYGERYKTGDGYSRQNETWGFNTEFMDPPNYIYKGVKYTLPDTCLAYDVQINNNCNKFIVKYSGESTLCGQPVEVRLGSETGEVIASFTTSGSGIANYKEETYSLNRELEAGDYTVYLCFGGNPNEIKTINLAWFGFDAQ